MHEETLSEHFYSDKCVQVNISKPKQYAHHFFFDVCSRLRSLGVYKHNEQIKPSSTVVSV